MADPVACGEGGGMKKTVHQSALMAALLMAAAAPLGKPPTRRLRDEFGPSPLDPMQPRPTRKRMPNPEVQAAAEAKRARKAAKRLRDGGIERIAA